MDGEQRTKLFASLMHHFPEYSRAGTHRLPRTARAFKGWRNLTPGKTNKAYHLVVWGTLSVDLAEKQFTSMVLFLLLAVATYCRPRELLALRRQDTVPPNRHTMKHWFLLISTSGTNARSKPGLQDTCVILDSGHPVDALLADTHHGVGYRNTPRNTLELTVSQFVPQGEAQRKTIGPGRPSHSMANTTLRIELLSGWKVSNIGRGSASRSVANRCRQFFDTTRAADYHAITARASVGIEHTARRLAVCPLGGY